MIHIISKDYYLKHLSGKTRSIIIKSIRFPNIKNKFFMTDDGTCFAYLQDLGILLVPEDSNLSGSVLIEPLDSENWYIEKYNSTNKLTINFINSFPKIDLKLVEHWIGKYSGFLRVWNKFTGEDFIFYFKPVKIGIWNNSNSYLCRLVEEPYVKFPIDLQKAREFSYLIRDILEWTLN